MVTINQHYVNVMQKFAGFVDIETPTLFKRTPEVKQK